jgi:nitrite reductase/ring-hydroxylating ferredoxin subunit
MTTNSLNAFDALDPLNRWQPLEGAAQLLDGGLGLRFEVFDTQYQAALPAFVIKHDGMHYAYVNQCAHIAMELDWQPEQFFDREGQRLICASHGALYEPQTGLCISGPCHGASLKAIELHTSNHIVYALKNI